jgi:hypothetical protein
MVAMDHLERAASVAHAILEEGAADAVGDAGGGASAPGVAAFGAAADGDEE